MVALESKDHCLPHVNREHLSGWATLKAGPFSLAVFTWAMGRHLINKAYCINNLWPALLEIQNSKLVKLPFEHAGNTCKSTQSSLIS